MITTGDNHAAALAAALRLAREGRFKEAAAALERVLEQNAEEPDALQLLGLIRREQGELEAAEVLLRRSLDVRPAQPHVLNNLGNVLTDRGRPEAAARCYQEALDADPSYFDARLNRGIALLAIGDAEGALSHFDTALSAREGNARAWACRGNALKALNRRQEAEAAFRQALVMNPRHVGALHNLGVLCKQTGRAREALDLLDRAVRISPERAEIHYNHGHALLANGRVDDALEAYGRAIRIKPDYAAAHDSLNKVLWQHGRGGYLGSYGWAARQRPEEPALWIDWADKLILAGRSMEAVTQLERALAAGHTAADIHHRLARALSVTGRIPEAEQAFTSALSLQPDSPRYLMDYARLEIVQGRCPEALHKLDKALAIAPDDQEAIAYRGVCWRLLGDPREAILNDYERYVRCFRIPAPERFGSIGMFNRSLLPALENLHRTAEPPAEQTLRGGTQTLDDLFDSGAPEVDCLRRQIEAAVSEYIEEMEGEAWHPLVRRRTGGFRFSGSWSVRLRSDGYHVNHVHSQGWISSCYYVALPACVASGDTEQGWLRFGETNLRLGDRERPAKAIRPQEGLLVLFPSFFFHGTRPFRSDQQRVTVAFDAVPA